MNKNSIKIKKILFVAQFVCFCIFAILFSFVMQLYYSNQMLATIAKQEIQALKSISSDVDNVVKNAYLLSDMLYKDYSLDKAFSISDQDDNFIIDAKSSLDQTYFDYYELFSQFGSSFMILCYGNNKFQYSSNNDFTDFSKLRLYSWFRKNIALKTDLYLTQNILLSIDGIEKSFFAVIRNVFDKENDYLGSIFICIPEEDLYSTYLPFIRNESQIYVLNNLSVVISSSDKDKIGKRITNHSTSSDKTDSYYIDKENVFNCKYVSELTNWTLYLKAPSSSLLTAINNALLITILFLCGFLILSSCVYYYIAKKIGTPLYAFCEEIKEFKNKDYKYKYFNSSIYEINHLQKTFDEMSTELSTSIVNNEKSKMEIQNANFNFLKAQINPHFLYNTLFSIKCTVDMDKKKEAIEMIEILISLLRDSISKNKATNTLLEECTYLTNYVKLQNLRYNNMIKLKVDLPEDLLNEEIPRFLIQPLIENAIIHGMPEDNSINNIELSFIKIDNVLRICVKDGGKGISKEKLNDILNNSAQTKKVSASTHIGLQNINQRIKYVFGNESLIQTSENGVELILFMKNDTRR